MARRRSNKLALDDDPTAALVERAYGGLNLAELRSRRLQLERVLDGAPSDVTEALQSAVERRDALRTRRRLRTNGSSTRWAARGSDRRASDIDRQLTAMEERVSTLQRSSAERRAFLEAHANVIDDLRLVRRAELAREMRVRASAAGQVVVVNSSAVDRRTSEAAAAASAVHLERFGRRDVEARDGVEALLGARPIEGTARLSYDRAVAALRAELLREVAAGVSGAGVEL
jgi:hypothetical protein